MQVFEQLAESGPKGALQEAREEENNSEKSREAGGLGGIWKSGIFKSYGRRDKKKIQIGRTVLI